MKLNFLILVLIFLSNGTFSQNDDVLFTVNKTKVTSNEFLRAYNKNINLVQNENQKDIDEYLKLFVNYKLKLEEAYSLKLDTNKKYSNELDSYRNQLSKKYLADTKISEDLLNEAYERYINEVDVNHILVKIDEKASPNDSLKAYNQILAYRKMALKDGFKKTMLKVNDGSNVFGESLGYFNAFKMVYPFENKAYETKVGDISKPFRTKFGFHILKVLDKRKSQGEVTVAHIMIANENKKITTSPEQRINDIWQKLNEDKSFSDLAKQFSDDIASARNGGQINRSFAAGELTEKEFEKAAFALKIKGDISKPIQTKYGWHIIKLIEKHNNYNFSEKKSFLENKIKKDSRSKIVNKKFYNNLKNRYNFFQCDSVNNKISKVINNDFLNGNWKPSIHSSDTILATFADQKISFLDYYNHIFSKLEMYKDLGSINEIIEVSYSGFINSRIYSYHKKNLEFEFPEYKNIIQEYKEGLLLFDLMNKNIWKKSKNDTLGLRNYYNNNIRNYSLKNRIEAVVVTSENKKSAKRISKKLKTDIALEELKISENKSVFSVGTFELSDKELPNDYKPIIGVSKIYKHNNQFIVVKLIKEYLLEQRTFEEVKGKVINDYQTKVENDWLINLSKKYEVVVNQNTLKSIKKTFE
jgi:peptidyl-prolyl cis-trans isomerase SurA